MTREDEINNASYAYWINNYANIEFIDEEEKELHTQDIQDSFINGAEWADRTMIAKACEWLEEFMQMTPSKKTFIKRFKQAMKGE